MDRLFIVGATSELGHRVVKILLGTYSSNAITCMVRKTSAQVDVKYLRELGVNICYGDVTDKRSFVALLNKDFIYIDMTHPKYYGASINIIAELGIKRAFFVTTTGLFSRYNYASDIYKRGEERIRNSGIVYTILRPSMIYGTERDRNMTKLLCYLSRWPIFPVFGSGKCLMQPVYVQDLAEGIVAAIIKSEQTAFKEYNLCGPDAISYIDLLDCAAKALNSNVRFLHIPHQLAVLVVAVAEKLPGFPICKEQVHRLLEDKCFDISLAQKELGYAPKPFAEGIALEIERLRIKGIL